jgi:hypothetical protein
MSDMETDFKKEEKAIFENNQRYMHHLINATLENKEILRCEKPDSSGNAGYHVWQTSPKAQFDFNKYYYRVKGDNFSASMFESLVENYKHARAQILEHTHCDVYDLTIEICEIDYFWCITSTQLILAEDRDAVYKYLLWHDSGSTDDPETDDIIIENIICDADNDDEPLVHRGEYYVILECEQWPSMEQTYSTLLKTQNEVKL